MGLVGSFWAMDASNTSLSLHHGRVCRANGLRGEMRGSLGVRLAIELWGSDQALDEHSATNEVHTIHLARSGPGRSGVVADQVLQSI